MTDNIQHEKSTSSYGNWPSAITADLVTGDSIALAEVQVYGDEIYYIERRPQEKGRCVIVRASGKHRQDYLPEGYSARSRVHEYGGGSFHVCEAGVFFCNDSDQDIYLIGPDGQGIRRITHRPDWRFADMEYDAARMRLIAVCEQHQASVTNSIISIDLTGPDDPGDDTGCDISALVQGADFYASPRLSPGGSHLCWQSWCFPCMPWDGNELVLAGLDDRGLPVNSAPIAGSDTVSVFQPRWADDDSLVYISDDTGWWQLYHYELSPDKQSQGKRRQLTSGKREFGLPQWVFGQSTYCILGAQRLLCSYRSPDSPVPGNRLLYIDMLTGDESEIDALWQEYDQINCDASTDTGSVAFIAASTDCFPQLVRATLNFDQAGGPSLDTRVIRTSCELPVASGYFVSARRLRFQNRHGKEVFANYYPPTHPDISNAVTDVRPPLIVICHGGPTGQSSAALDPRKLYWTSRGYALLDVDYSGSTGYGRAYRERLNGQWGKLDVEDCCDAALFAVAQGLADAGQLIIRGSSAGGLTVLAALTFHDEFAAGACYYGISDLASLAGDTHKFESRYTDIMVGPWPEAEALYRERSPVHHTGLLNTAVIFFQGKDDRVVPMAQTEKMVDALKNKGIKVAAQYFAGEQHGFHRSTTIEQCLENELAFYTLVLDLDQDRGGEDSGLSDTGPAGFRGCIELSNI